MSRRRRINTQTAEKAGTKPPQRKSGPKPSHAEMLTRRRAIRTLMLVEAPIARCVEVLQRKFSDVDEKAVLRMYEEEEQAVIAKQGARILVKKAKQEARLLDSIGAASAKGAYSAVSALEKTYADVAGTNAPIRFSHEVSYTDKQNDAFKRVVFGLNEQQADELLIGNGAVPLGIAGRPGQVIETDGEEIIAKTNGSTNGKKTNGG